MRVDWNDLDITDDAVVRLYEGVPFTGIAYETDDDGQTIVESTFVNGHIAGIQRDYYSSGQIRQEWYVRNGLSHGVFRSWYENGQVESEQLMEYGICVKKRLWNENEELIEETEIGEEDPLYSLLMISRGTRPEE
jgi:antitoxin component YwqK of YwqJK toxin-antitoxin module